MMSNLTCPHCGFSQELLPNEWPADGGAVTCSSCHQAFHPEVFQAQDPDETAVSSTETILLTCIHCGQNRAIRRDRIPPGMQKVRCRKCGEEFSFNIADLPGASTITVGLKTPPMAESPGRVKKPLGNGSEQNRAARLPTVIDLFARSWHLFKQRIWTLLGIYLLSFVLPAAAVGVLTALTVPLLIAAHQVAEGLVYVLGALLALILVLGMTALFSWGMGSMIVATVDTRLNWRQSLAAGWKQLWAFAWLFGLLGLVVGGGFFLLVIPGLIMMTWFMFAQYLLPEEGERGMAALLKSREYVRGFFWGVLLRLLVLWVATAFLSLLIGWIPLVGNLLNLFLFPFTLIYQYLLLVDLRAAQGTLPVRVDGANQKVLWLLVGILGYLVLPAAFWMAGGPEMLRGYYREFQKHQQIEGIPDPSLRFAPPLKEVIGPEPPPVRMVRRADYLKLLDTEKAAFQEGGISLGPVAVRIDEFWSGMGAPHLWLKVRSAPLPNLELMENGALQVTIDRVSAEGGSDQYDRNSMFEKPFFQQVALRSVSPGEVMEGTRDVYLLPGTDADELQEIQGTFLLRLPLQVRTLELTPSMMGKRYRVGTRELRFVTLQGGAVEIEIEGSLTHLLRVVGYNSAGQPLAEAGSNRVDIPGGTRLTKMFQGELFSVKVFFAEKFLEKEYAFALPL